MFERLKEDKVLELLAYFEKDPRNCLYSYIDLKKYSLSNPNLEIFIDRNGSGELICAVTHYYSGVNVYSFDCDLDTEATAALIAKIAPDMVNAPLAVIDVLEEPLRAVGMKGIKEVGFVTDITRESLEIYKLGRGAALEKDASTMQHGWIVETAKEEDLPEVAKLICTDEGVGGTYTPEGLAEQLKARMEDHFGRCYCIRKDGKIVCHAGTYAEVPGMAVISGVITADGFRGQRLAERVVFKLNEDLYNEGMTPGLFYYTDSAAKLYKNLGFREGSKWAKLIFKA